MRFSTIAILAFSLAIGCSPTATSDVLEPDLTQTDATHADTPSIRLLAGEVMLHEFEGGGHAQAGYLTEPVPIERVNWNHVISLEPAPSQRVGNCSLFVVPRCQPTCPQGQLCTAENSCSVFAPIRYRDGGRMRVTGSQSAPQIELWFQSPESGYMSEPPPGRASLFRGGELLHFTGGTGDGAFDVTLRAPRRVELELPMSGLRIPDQGEFEIRWRSESMPPMIVLLSASGPDGRTAYVRCVAADAGVMSIPRVLLDGLPGRPRYLHLEVDRSSEIIVPLGINGQGFLVHAAHTATRNWSE